MTQKVVKPIALDESFRTTEQNPQNIADVLANKLDAIKSAIENGGSGEMEAAFECHYNVTSATDIYNAMQEKKVPFFYQNGMVAQLWKVETNKYTFRTTSTRVVEGENILDIVDYIVNGSVWSTATKTISGGSSSQQAYLEKVKSSVNFDTTGLSGMQSIISVDDVPADGVYQLSIFMCITPKTASATKSDLVFGFSGSAGTGMTNTTFHAVVDDSQTFAQQLSFSTTLNLKAGTNSLKMACGGRNTEYLVFVDDLTVAQIVNGVYHNGDTFEEVNDLTEALDFNADDELLVVSPNSTRKMIWTTLANKVLGFIKSLSTTITSFRTGDVIPVDGPSGTAKMPKDDLLAVTAQNTLAGNVAPEFDPTRTSENPYLTGEIVIYQGKLRIFKRPHYGAWNVSHVAMSGRDLVNAYKIYMESLENGALNYDREFSFPFVNATLKSFPLDAVFGVGCEITMALSGDFVGKVTLGALADNQESPYTNIIGFKTTGTTTTVTATFLTHSIAFWMSDGHTGGTVTANLSIRPKKIDLTYLEDAVSDLETRAQELEELNTITGRPSSTTSKTHTYQRNTLLTYDGFDIGPGNILRVTQSGEFSGEIFVAYFDEGGTRHDNVIIVNGQGSGEYEMPEVSHNLAVWLSGNSSDVGKDVVMTFDVVTNVTGKVINEIKRKVNTEFTRNKFKNFSIIGDSYSTYYGWIPSGNNTWYAVDGIDGNNSNTNDVDAVEDTWWHKLSKALEIGLIRNESLSGSSISYTNYGSVKISPSFVARAEHLDQNNVLLSKPELIIIMGGTNDAWSRAVCGDPMYSGWTDEDLKKFAPALCKLINDLIKWNPQATILNVVNTGFPADYNSAIETITEHYGILNLFLSFSSSDKQNGHPNKSGMTKICNQIIEKLNAS